MTAPESVARHRGAAVAALSFGLVVTSDSRTVENDATTPMVRALIEGAGHRLDVARLVANRDDAIGRALDELVGAADVRVALVSGGTGFGPRDRSVDVVTPRFERPIPGFGELFRSLSFAEIGAAALLSRASAGIVGGKPVFLLPGSPDGVRLALERLVLPEIGHLVAHLERRV
jgi:molybdenum cofactor biosynthesis protein B